MDKYLVQDSLQFSFKEIANLDASIQSFTNFNTKQHIVAFHISFV